MLIIVRIRIQSRYLSSAVAPQPTFAKQIRNPSAQTRVEGSSTLEYLTYPNKMGARMSSEMGRTEKQQIVPSSWAQLSDNASALPSSEGENNLPYGAAETELSPSPRFNDLAFSEEETTLTQSPISSSPDADNVKVWHYTLEIPTTSTFQPIQRSSSKPPQIRATYKSKAGQNKKLKKSSKTAKPITLAKQSLGKAGTGILPRPSGLPNITFCCASKRISRHSRLDPKEMGRIIKLMEDLTLSTPQGPTEFKLFSKLPSELRIQVWKLALPLKEDQDGRRVISILLLRSLRIFPRFLVDASGFSPLGHTSPQWRDLRLLSTCRESRIIFLETFKHSIELGYGSRPQVIRFDDRATIFVRNFQELICKLAETLELGRPVPAMSRAIKHVAYTTLSNYNRFRDFGSDLLKVLPYFASLVSITISPSFGEDFRDHDWIHISELRTILEAYKNNNPGYRIPDILPVSHKILE